MIKIGTPYIFGVALMLAGPAHAADLQLKRVMLSSGGVGYFEYEAEVEGNAALSFHVRRDQVDDLLKSIVVFDERGAVGQVSLVGEDALQDIFRELPFDGSALESPADLLNALRGNEVTVAGSSALSGRIMSAALEHTELPNGRGVVPRVRLTLVTQEGLRTATIQDLDAISFKDAALQTRLSGALAAVAAAAARERRTLSVQAQGQGKRMLRVAYVSEAPLWKASYRLTLDADPGAKKADLQGWAVLENRSGADWKDVELTLVSGSPVTFRQALYATYYVDRPNVPVEVVGRVLPKPDLGGIPRQSADSRARHEAPMAPSPQVPRNISPGPMGAGEIQSRVSGVSGGAPALAELLTGDAEDQQTQVRFRLPRPVTLANGHNILVPIVARAVPAERVALYQPETHRLHPLAAVDLANDGTSALPPGIVTLYGRDERGVAYLGDARLAPLPQGESRLLAYAIDNKVRIDVEDQGRSDLTKARFLHGVLDLTYIQSTTTLYTVAAPSGDARKLLLEQPRLPGASIVKPSKGIELAGPNWRIANQMPTNSVPIEVTTEMPVLQRHELRNLKAEEIRFFLQSRKLSEKERDALSRLAHLVNQRAEAEQVLKRLEEENETLNREQQRLRANIHAVPQGSDLHRRYLQQLAQQEDRFAALKTELEVKRALLQSATTQLNDYIKTLNL